MPSGYKKDSFGYYVDTAQGKIRIKKEGKQWFTYNLTGAMQASGFRSLTEALTWIEEGWHVL